ncbi:MAG: MFS transporter [Planctomycetaceae bacterium]|nr:MFS transporter [Planctomycetaceae bacterium]
MSSARLYDRNYNYALLSQVGFAMVNTAMLAHYPRWIAHLGGEVNATGWITGTASIAGLVLRPWIGQWIDRFGAKTIWLSGYAIFSVGSLSNLCLLGLGPEIYACRALLVIGGAIIFSSALTYVTHLAPNDRRAEAIGTLGAAAFLGIVFGPFLGELVLSAERTREEFETLFVGGVLLLLLPVSLLMLLQPAASEPGRGSVRFAEFVRTSRRHWPGMIVVLQVTFGLCVTVPFVFLTKFVDDTGLASDGVSRVSQFFMCYAGWGLTLRILLRRTPDRFGRRKMALVGAVVMALGMFSFLLVDSSHPNRIVIPALLCGTGHSLMYHTCTSLFLDSFPPDVRGAGSGLSMVALDIGSVGGAQLLGEVAFRFGYDRLFVIVALVTLAMATIFAISSIPLWRERQRKASLLDS